MDVESVSPWEEFIMRKPVEEVIYDGGKRKQVFQADSTSLGESVSAYPAPSSVHKSRSRLSKQQLEREHCEFLKLGYPPNFEQIGKEQFDQAITRQMLLKTPRRLEIARLVALGIDYGEIAAQLDIATDTVKKRVEAMMSIAGVDRRGKFLRWFMGL